MHKMLERLAQEYAYQRMKPFAQSDFGNFVRHDLALEAKKKITFLPYDLKVKASVGSGNWASVPWLGFFDPLITETATRGFYVVYLINPQTNEITLSLNQGTTAAYESFGIPEGREYLRRTAVELFKRAGNFSKHFSSDPIDLGSLDSLPQGYMAGHAFGRTYAAGNINETQFTTDFENMLAAYEYLIEMGGTTPGEIMLEDAGLRSVEESRKYVLSKRIERAPNVRPKVLQAVGAICQGCGLDPKITYGYNGPLKNTPLDVHHAKPISGLSEGESRRYKIPDDFMVLCPTCHRMIHKQVDPSDLRRLKASINSGILRPKNRFF